MLDTVIVRSGAQLLRSASSTAAAVLRTALGVRFRSIRRRQPVGRPLSRQGPPAARYALSLATACLQSRFIGRMPEGLHSVLPTD